MLTSLSPCCLQANKTVNWKYLFNSLEIPDKRTEWQRIRPEKNIVLERKPHRRCWDCETMTIRKCNLFIPLALLRDISRAPVWTPLTGGSCRLYFPWTALTRCPCWQACVLLKRSQARSWIRVSCRGAAVSLTLTSELPGLGLKSDERIPLQGSIKSTH